MAAARVRNSFCSCSSRVSGGSASAAIVDERDRAREGMAQAIPYGKADARSVVEVRENGGQAGMIRRTTCCAFLAVLDGNQHGKTGGCGRHSTQTGGAVPEAGLRKAAGEDRRVREPDCGADQRFVDEKANPGQSEIPAGQSRGGRVRKGIRTCWNLRSIQTSGYRRPPP